MKTASPLRYPGGKSAMTALLSDIRYINRLGSTSIAEPYAGGAGASLSMLYLERCENLLINDADPAIFAFWWALLNRTQQFMDKLSSTRVNITEWRRQKEIYHSKAVRSRVNKGFAAFYLNRCNRSGIIMNGGPIGGQAQAGEWKINARYNKAGLKERCERVTLYKERIAISSEDGIIFIQNQDANSTFFFIDPPYYEKGQELYNNALDHEYHESLAEQMKSMKDHAWVMTYDDCPEIRKMYRGWARIRPFSLRYAAAKRRMGNEILIIPKWMRLPTNQTSASLLW